MDDRMTRDRISNGHSLGADVALRATGMGLVAVAVLAVRLLVIDARLDPPVREHAADLLLAAVAFLGGSGGAYLVALGTHIHDRIRIGLLWSAAESCSASQHEGRAHL